MREEIVRERDQALIFIVAVLAISWSFEGFIIVHGGVQNFALPWMVVLMCIPGALAVALRLILKAGFKDAGFRFGKARFYFYAITVPLLSAFLTGLMSVALDIRQLSMLSPEQLVDVSPVLLYVLLLGLLGAFGEELGWRGFLLPKMVSGGVKRPYLASGVVWAAWHAPLIAFGGIYQAVNASLMTLIYCLGILAMNFFFSELRTRSGSVWVSTIAHAAHNFIFQFAVPVLLLTATGSRSELEDMLTSDTGLSIAALYGVAYLVLHYVVGRDKDI